MTVTIQAYCGLDCSECPARLAHVNDDDALRNETIKKWSTPEFPVTADILDCAGCKSDGPHFAFCSKCSVRECAEKHGVATCAHCDEYGCEILEEWLSHVGEKGREILEKIRDTL